MKRLRNGFLAAETFEEHMQADIEWLEDKDFADAFAAEAAQQGPYVDYDTANLQFAQPVKVPLTRTGSALAGSVDPHPEARVRGRR